jgi:peptidoglycan/LPS O-acetylase OafA/YrhL
VVMVSRGPTGADWMLPAFYGAMWTVPFALLLISLAAAPQALLSRFFATRALVTLGTASYAVYLTHRPLLPYLGTDPGNVVSPGGVAAYLAVLVVIGLCLLIGEGAHRLVEVPSRQALLRLIRRPRAKAPDLQQVVSAGVSS